jgi:hypothetical protein
MHRVKTVIAVAFVWYATTVSGALAAGGGEKVGQNTEHLLTSWAGSLYVGITAVIALMLLVNRKIGDLFIFVLAAIVVGGFVFDPHGVTGMVRDIWSSVTA